ncbi:MAG: hypothetical protein QOH29_1178 [Actinomycetota bacterium]|nr:hypothetical protein [Actinomycetota bacterium]
MAGEMVAAARDTAHAADEVLAIHDAAERLAATWTRSYESAEGRVSASQLRALMAVHRAGDLSVTQLADELGAMVSSASRLCDRLVAAGYLVRDQNPHSRRQILVRVTSDGRRLLAEIRRFRLRELRTILGRMPKADRQALLRGLRAWDRADGGSRP